MKTAIPYYRVSTDKQGESGLGLEAQKTAVQEFAQRQQLTLLAEQIEIESGVRNNRPVLHRASKLCRSRKGILVIAKLDRLGRNVAFISALMESQVEFIAVDNPYANKLVIHIMAAFAEHERDMISARTKEALQAAKRRGVILGTNGRDNLSKRNRRAADHFALKMKSIISDLNNQGFMTIRDIRDELNRRQVPTFFGNGAKWHLPTVHNVLNA